VLVSLVVITTGILALVGALTSSASSSANHRAIVSLDTLLKSFAEAAKYQIQLQPASSSPYADCATNYRVVSVYPTSAPVGAGITVFATDFPTNAAATVTVGSAAPIAVGNTSGTGTVSATVTVPSSLGPGAQTVLLTAGGVSQAAATSLTVPALGAPEASAVSGYAVNIASIGWWNGATFDSPSSGGCTAADHTGVELLNLTASSPQGRTDALGVTVINPTYTPPLPAPAVMVTATPPSPLPGQQFTFSATLTGSIGGAAPTGTVTWSFLSGTPGTPSCTQSTLVANGNSSTTSPNCIVASAQLGTYQVSASYSGDGNYSPTIGYGSAVVAKSTPTMTVTPSPLNGSAGNPITFTATVIGPTGGATPTGTVTWSITGPTSPTCAPSSLSGSGISATTTCTVTGTVNGLYTATATYPGDANYNSASASGSASIGPFVIETATLGNGGGTAGKIEDGDTVAITLSQAVHVSTICSAWSGDSSNQSDGNGTVTITNGTGNKNDKLSVTDTDCPTFNFGTIDLGSKSYVNATVTFSQSAVQWNATTYTLLITLGAQGGSGATSTVSTSTPVFTASSSITSVTGMTISNSPFTLPSGKQF